MRDRRRDEPAERVGADASGGGRARAREQICDRLPRRPHRRAAEEATTTASAVANPATAPANRRSPRARASEGSTATRIACDASTIDDEDAVRGEETVRLLRAAELVRDDDADDGGEAGHDERRRRGERRTRQGAQAGRVCTLGHRRGSVRTMPNDTLWTGAALDDLRSEFGDAYEGRTVLVTGADGFMGSHLTDALVELGANVHAFVRATSSGALNNIGHLRNRLKVHFADLTDRTSVDYLVRELKDSAADRPYVFHLGAQAHVGESWHRPYETVTANVARNAQPPPVGRRRRPRAREVRHGRHVGGVRERARGGLRPPRLRRRRRPHPPRALADQPEVDLRDGEGRRGLPDDELLRRVRRAGRRHADVQQLRAAPEPALRDGDDHHAGARRARRSSSARSIRCATSASARTACAAT